MRTPMRRLTRSMTAPSLALVLALALAGYACSSNDATPAPPPDASAPDTGAPEAGDDAGEPQTPVPLKVTVYERTWPDFAAVTTKPLANALVLADLPDGTRKEATTDASGTVTFPDVDFTKGTASVTAYRVKSPLVSRVGITRDTAANQRLWVRAIPPEMINVLGTVKNFDPRSAYIVVESPHSNTRYQNVVGPSSSSFIIQVPKGKPVTLISSTFANKVATTDAGPVNGREEDSVYYGWVRKDLPASDNDIGDVELDFSQTLTPQTTHGTIRMSSKRTSALFTDAEPYFQVSRIGNLGFFGAPTRTIISADGFSSSFEGPYVKVDGLDKVGTEYQLQLGPGFSFVRFSGYPLDGADVAGFIEEPQMVQPPDPTTPGKITDPIVWRTLDPAARGTVLLDRAGVGIVCELTSVSSAPIVTVPAPPSTLDRKATFGTTPLQAFIQLGVDCDPPEDPWYWSCNRGAMQTQPLFLIDTP